MQIHPIRLDHPHERDAFIRMPDRLYAAFPAYVKPLLQERRDFFHPAHPRFLFTDAALFLLRDPYGRPIGRISAHVDRQHNSVTGETAGFFGFFECIPNLQAATLLLQAAEEHLRTHGATYMRGPCNFSPREECGFLVQGHDEPPAFLMPFTHPVYPTFMTPLGLRHIQTLLAYDIRSDGTIPERLLRLHPNLHARSGFHLRSPSRNVPHELASLFSLYNQIWQHDPEFVPITEAQLQTAVTRLGRLIDPNLIVFAEKHGTAAGVAVALPDYNQVICRMNGTLWPFGWLHAVAWKQRRLVRRARILLLGVLPRFRQQGLEALLCRELFRRGLAAGYQWAEGSWVRADNLAIRRPLERLGGRVSKVYHLYEKPLN